eukprot:CAMPEP_0194040670 /NCGR_PEP_ID=MMETSP0009_2-20130614/12632_1 /TAXON_ID=210454 /ORGANISM="Grammatophora oceanica, Strain CCMP 410" /LENGTH=92 /DNA_ID=CAMNT_0038683881 /DNA_START=66 /DNA_END=344 /DNA_ORIENTATION=+
MIRSLFLFALFVVAASAFVAPANRALSQPAFARAQAPKMTLIEADVAVSSIANNANLIASSVTDFGGYLFPVFGLLSLGGIILFLAPPLADE